MVRRRERESCGEDCGRGTLSRQAAHVPTDPDVAAYEARAESMLRDAPHAPAAWFEPVRRACDAFSTVADDVIASRFKVDDARHVLAHEHGSTCWADFVTRIDALTRGATREPLRDAVQAIREERLEDLSRMLSSTPEPLQRTGTHGHSLLAHAVLQATDQRAIPTHETTPSQLEAVRIVIDSGHDPSATADHGWSPLHIAAMAGNTRLATVLLDAGASVEPRAWAIDGATPLAHALFYAHTETAHAIARDARAPDNLRVAAALGDVARLRSFFDDASRLDPSAAFGRSFTRPILLFPATTPTDDPQETIDDALAWASRNGQVEACDVLVEMGADVNSNPSRGTPLLWAIYKDQTATAAWLLEHGAEPNLRHDFGGAQHGKGATALHLAAQFGALDSIRLLLEHGADPTIEDELYSGTAVDWAEVGGMSEAASMLRQQP